MKLYFPNVIFKGNVIREREFSLKWSPRTLSRIHDAIRRGINTRDEIRNDRGVSSCDSIP